jgi:prophage antirepressor-like protein
MNALAQFHGTPVNIINHSGQRWLTAKEVGLCLGYAETNAGIGIQNLFNRHIDRFDSNDSALINLIKADGKNGEVRVFSLSGCVTLGWLSNTERAKEFQRWAKQVLARELAGAPPVPGATAAAIGRNGRARITRQTELDVLTLFAQGWAQRAIAKHLGVSPTVVSNLLHAKHRFTVDAGQDLTTPELIEIVVNRHMADERQRLTQKYIASASNQHMAQLLEAKGSNVFSLTQGEAV